MTKEKPTEPRLRFPGFTDAWKQRKLGDFLEESKILGSKGDVARKLTVRLWGKGVVSKKEIYRGSSATQYYIRKSGQFIYGKLDFLNQAFGIIPQELDSYESTLDSPAFNLLEGINGQFLIEFVSRKEFYYYQGNIANGSRKAKRIHTETFLGMPIVLPTLPEQEAIGSFFSDLDQLITLHQRKLDSVKGLKKALLQKMFPKGNGNDFPELRFPEFTDAWKQRKLGEVVYRSNITSANKTLPRLEFEDINSGTGTLNKDIRQKIYDSRKGLEFKEEDILFGKLRPYLKKWWFAEYKGIAVGDFWNLKSDIWDNRFLFTYVQSNSFQVVANDTSGTKMPRSDWKLVSNSIAIFPTLPEQEAIGSFFSNLDQLITLHQRQLDHLKLLKKALLQQMFV
ncbi:restriction endonuclease subunit S [Streptococcus suis]